MEINVWTVLIAAGVTALCTGLGALPFLFLRDLNRWWLGVFDSVAAGLMLAASFGLIQEGFAMSAERTIAGVLLGLVLIVLADRFVDAQDLDVGELHGAGAKKAILILGIMTAYSFAEGIGVGVSFGDGETLGMFITMAIAVHNIPEGLAISLVLIPRGTSVVKAAGWSIFTSLPQPLMAVPAFLFVLVFTPFLPVGLGLAAGAMVLMVFAELISDAMEHSSAKAVGVAVTLSFTGMLAFQSLVLK